MNMRLNDYDPDDPPRSTHRMEMDRKIGVALPRLGIAIVLLLLAGVDFQQIGLLHLAELDWPQRFLSIILFVWVGWPLVQGIEHGLCDLRS